MLTKLLTKELAKLRIAFAEHLLDTAIMFNHMGMWTQRSWFYETHVRAYRRLKWPKDKLGARIRKFWPPQGVA